MRLSYKDLSFSYCGKARQKVIPHLLVKSYIRRKFSWLQRTAGINLSGRKLKSLKDSFLAAARGKEEPFAFIFSHLHTAFIICPLTYDKILTFCGLIISTMNNNEKIHVFATAFIHNILKVCMIQEISMHFLWMYSTK